LPDPIGEANLAWGSGRVKFRAKPLISLGFFVSVSQVYTTTIYLSIYRKSLISLELSKFTSG